MSEKICDSDQRKLNQIFKQVRELSDIVDELRTEVNNLKKVSFGARHEDVSFEYAKVNSENDRIRPSVLHKLQAYFKRIKGSTTNENICRITKSNQFDSPRCVAQGGEEKDDNPLSCEPTAIVGLSAIYSSLKSFKNRILKIVQRVSMSPRSSRNTENKCVTFNERQQVCDSSKEELFKFNKKNENDVSRYTDVSQDSDDLADTFCTSNSSVQEEITTCSNRGDDRMFTHSYQRKEIKKNNVQTSPLSVMSDDLPDIRSDRFADKISYNRATPMCLRNKLKRYKRCSCGSQCPYALYKLPCTYKEKDTLRNNTNEEIDELSLECTSFEKSVNYPKFVTINTGRKENSQYVTDIGAYESLTSSLSVDLEFDVCDLSGELENVDELQKRRAAKTYVVNKTSAKKNDDLITYFKTDDEPFSDIISLWKNIDGKREKVDKIVEDILFLRKYINPEASQQIYKNSRTKSFMHNRQLTINNDKQIQCAIPTFVTSATNCPRTSVKTSTPTFQRNGIVNQPHRMTNRSTCVQKSTQVFRK